MKLKCIKIGLALFIVFGAIYLVLVNYDGSPIWEYYYLIPVLVGYDHVDPAYIAGSGIGSILGITLVVYGLFNKSETIEKYN